MKRSMRWLAVATMVAVFSAAVPLFAQIPDEQLTTPQAVIDAATQAMQRAEAVGAPLYAKALYDEAQWRINFAKANMNADKRSTREEAQLRGRQALRAAEAAEAKARLVQAATEAKNLKADIQRFGGNVPDVRIMEAPAVPADRGSTSKDKLHLAETAVAEATAAGAKSVAPDAMAKAEDYIATARTILRTQKQSDSAEHLAFIAEMLARESQYKAMMQDSTKYLPGLRLERTRLAQAASEAQAAEERRRREEAERQAAELRTKLAQEAQSRQAQAAQVEALRQQLAQRELALQQQLTSDRAARLAAEQQLSTLMSRYEASLMTPGGIAEADSLRRQVEDQRLALQNYRDQESRSLLTLQQENARLRQLLEQQANIMSPEELARQQAQLLQQQEDLQKMVAERDAQQKRFDEVQAAHDRAIAEARSRLEQSQAETAELKKQVESTQAELQKTREELARRVAAEEEREKMRAALAEIAQTKQEARGLVVTLPGIYFDVGKSALKPGAKNVLDKIADQIKGNAELKISVEGHTDSTGAAEMNQKLSRDRADAVKEYLVGRGIDGGRITATGMGEDAPVATNNTAAGRQQNRRVELIITQ